MKRIVSRANASFKSLRALKDSTRERRARGQTVLDGPHLVRAYLERVGQPVLAAVSADAVERPEITDLLRRLEPTEVLCFAPELFGQITPVENAAGILAIIDIPGPPTPREDAGDFVVLLDRIQDPGNVGTITRSAAGCGADALLMCPACADPWSPRALRAAMGATFALPVHAGADLSAFARRFDGLVVATSGHGGLPPSAIDLTGRVALLFGNEGVGLSEHLAETSALTASIPLERGIESLNVGAAAAIVMFERVRQLAVKGQGTRRQP